MTYLHQPLKLNNKNKTKPHCTALPAETAEQQQRMGSSDCRSQEPLVQNRVTEQTRLRTHGCSSNSFPGHPALPVLQNSRSYSRSRLGPPCHFTLAKPMAFVTMWKERRLEQEETEKRRPQGSVLLRNSHLAGVLACHQEKQSGNRILPALKSSPPGRELTVALPVLLE